MQSNEWLLSNLSSCDSGNLTEKLTSKNRFNDPVNSLQTRKPESQLQTQTSTNKGQIEKDIKNADTIRSFEKFFELHSLQMFI
mmetsp:Transcript_22278/g.25798  ORF Transcript_22278/g.25798 Transcript_22278/m.25798 type:complete len:83 (+) Transcript_22278:54-302(+)